MHERQDLGDYVSEMELPQAPEMTTDAPYEPSLFYMTKDQPSDVVPPLATAEDIQSRAPLMAPKSAPKVSSTNWPMIIFGIAVAASAGWYFWGKKKAKAPAFKRIKASMQPA